MFRQLWAGIRTRLRAPQMKRLSQEIEALEIQALCAPLEGKADIYVRIGDLCLERERRDHAVFHYGRGVDSHLKTGHFLSAAALCRKMIKLTPEVVRARCTLAFLALGDGLIADAERQIADYVRAAAQAGTEELAVKRLRLMASATDEHEIRLLLGEYLVSLGDAQAADEVYGAVFAEQNGLRPSPREDQRERWARLLRVSLTGPVETDEKIMN
jgi:hypothetical protein